MGLEFGPVVHDRQQLGEKPVICILGSTTFNDPKTEETVVAVLAASPDGLCQ